MFGYAFVLVLNFLCHSMYGYIAKYESYTQISVHGMVLLVDN